MALFLFLFLSRPPNTQHFASMVRLVDIVTDFFFVSRDEMHLGSSAHKLMGTAVYKETKEYLDSPPTTN